MFVFDIADPGAPSTMLANQTMDTKGICLLHITWSAPSNIEPRYVSHYMIHVNGSNLVNHTNLNNQQSHLITYPVCTCGSHNVSITAVSTCDSIGQSTDNYTTMPARLYNITCDGITPDPNTSDDGKFA